MCHNCRARNEATDEVEKRLFFAFLGTIFLIGMWCVAFALASLA